MTPPPTIGWGVIGCGWVARDYVIPALLQTPGARLVAACDSSSAACTRVAAVAPGIFTTPDLPALLAHPEVQAVYIATPNHLHRPLTEAAAAAGKHVLCEKPMATTLADAEAMVAACHAAGVTYATAFDQRFHTAHQQLHTLIRAGRLGTITSVRIHYACWTPPEWRPPTDDGGHDNWRADPARAGGGAGLDLAPHGLDLVQMLLDEELTEVTGLRQQRIHAYPVDDGAALLGRFRSGALLLHHVAYNCPDHFPRRTLEVMGTEAMAVATNTMGQTPGGELRLISAHTGATEVIPLHNQESPFLRGVAAYTQCLQASQPFPFPPARDLHTMRLLAQGLAL